MKSEDRIKVLRKSALAVAKKHGYMNTTRHMIALHAKVSPALVPAYMGDVADMRDMILEDGCEEGCVPLIIEGVLNKKKLAKDVVHLHRDKIIEFIFK